MTIIDKVLERLDTLTTQVYENKVEILKALRDCPKGAAHEEEIRALQLWRERLMGKLAVIVTICSIAGSGIVILAADLLRWKIGIGMP